MHCWCRSVALQTASAIEDEHELLLAPPDALLVSFRGPPDGIGDRGRARVVAGTAGCIAGVVPWPSRRHRRSRTSTSCCWHRRMHCWCRSVALQTASAIEDEHELL